MHSKKSGISINDIYDMKTQQHVHYWSTRGGGDFIAESFGGQGGAGAWSRKSTNLLVGCIKAVYWVGWMGGDDLGFVCHHPSNQHTI